ncbi:LysR family transcriptional regulator, partial [Xylella fastidiosa subsp. multiplex]|nr:LysR family transcriptional regulator [Xylella fastidiosa subsp. multiplex]
RRGVSDRSASAPRLSRTLAIVVRRDKPLSRGLRHLQEALLALRG